MDAARRIWRAIQQPVAVITGLIGRLVGVPRGRGDVPGGHIFENETGTFDFSYNMRIVNGEILEGTAPQRLDCRGASIIYSVQDMAVGNCNGFGGPNDGNNAACATAEAAANAIANGITCPTEFPKQIVEIFRGWSCRNLNPGGLTATGAVELKVTCPVTA